MHLKTALLFAFPLISSGLVNASFVRIDNLESTITWTPGATQAEETCRNHPDNNACTGSWWVEHTSNDFQGSTSQTWGPNTAFSFSFSGRSFMIFGVKFWAGAGATVMVDGNVTGTFTCRLDGVNDPQRQQLLYTQTDIDDSKVHSVIVSYNPNDFDANGNRRWLGIDYVLVDATSSSSAAAVITTATTTVTVTASSSSMNGTTLGLVVVVPILALLTIGLTVYLLIVFRRKRSEDKLEQPQYEHYRPVNIMAPPTESIITHNSAILAMSSDSSSARPVSQQVPPPYRKGR